MPTRREAFVAAAALAVAPLAVASGSPVSETIPETPEPSFTIDKGIISHKEWSEEWRERCRLNLEEIQRRSNIQGIADKALIRFGFDIREIAKVRKDICKRNPCEEHYKRFCKDFGFKWSRKYRSHQDSPPWNLGNAWDAVLVTYRTSQDGFKILDVDMWWEKA